MSGDRCQCQGGSAKQTGLAADCGGEICVCVWTVGVRDMQTGV